MFGVTWIGGVDTPEELDKMNAINLDAGYLEMIAAAGTNKLFEQGSSRRGLWPSCPERHAQIHIEGRSEAEM